MIGFAYHPPSLVNLMIDRDKFSVVVVPSELNEGTKEALEKLFAKKAPKGTNRLILVEGVSTVSRVAALFPEQKVRVAVFDVADRLDGFARAIVDLKESDGLKKLVSVKPEGLNQGLFKMTPVALEDYRKQYKAEEGAIAIAVRDGAFVTMMKNSSKPLQRTACQYLLGQTTFAALKRAARKDGSKVSMVSAYTDSDKGIALNYAFMDMALYGTDSKESAIFSGADLEDLRYVTSIIAPEADLEFAYAVPEKLRSARE